MSLAELEKYTFTAKYSRWLKDKKRRETWTESVNRCRDMMIKKYSHIKDVLPYIEQSYNAIQKKEIVGSQRALQFGGEPVFRHNSRLYNCTSSYVDRPRFFQECMYLLMTGCGTGFSVQKHHVNKLPNLISPSGSKLFEIPDSIEGWSDAIGIIVNSYFDGGIYPEYEGKRVQFDYSNIRERGAILSSGSKAPGPEPLKNAIGKIRKILDRCLESGLNKLRPIDCYDIIMHSSDAVLSGGIRRSATTALFSIDDMDMRNAKTGNWLEENPQRARSNNSVALLKDSTTKEQFLEILSATRQFGEPGFAWVDDLEHILNPCYEVSMYCYNSRGLSGWQGCNLSSINCKKIKTEEDFYRACENAAIVGTLQAGFTDFPYLGKVSEEIFEREALLGVSMTGILEVSEICTNPEIQRNGARIVKETNKKIAKIIGINQAARTTVVKPEGTTSCVLGCSSGIHPHHASKYIRRVQANKDEEVYQYFKTINPQACEESVWSANRTDDFISFCINVPKGARLKKDVQAIDLLEIVKNTQINWVIEGKNEHLCTQKWLTHNVSNTITVKEDEWDKVADYIYNNREYFCGISLLSDNGDKDYNQAPFMAVFNPSEVLSEYGDGALFVSGLITKACELWDDDLWDACDALLGLSKYKGKEKKLWIDKCTEFANKYMDNNIKRLTYCLKDVYNWKLWLDLNRTYKPVDYENLIEETDNVRPEQEVSCAGGQCNLV